METLTTTTLIPIFSPTNKSKNLSSNSNRFLRFSASPQSNSNSNNNNSSDSDLKPDSTSIVPFFNNRTMSKDEGMGLVLSAANVRGWTTGSGMEGPPVPVGSESSNLDQVSTFPWSLFTKSPRRRMRVAFTCNVCGQRTTRAINPHAYTDGTVFVQCCGCNIFHKLVDNLNLFHEMKCYVNSSFNPDPIDNMMNVKYFDEEEDNSDDIFPLT